MTVQEELLTTDKIPHTLKGDGKGTNRFITDYEYYNVYVDSEGTLGKYHKMTILSSQLTKEKEKTKGKLYFLLSLY